LRVGKIPGDKSGMKALTHLKHNLSAAGPSFTYTTGKDEVTFGNIVELTPSDLDISARRTAGYVPVEEAVEFIIGEITHGAIPVADLDGKAEAMGFTANSITNAKRKLKAENRIEVFPDNSGSRGSSGWFIGPPGQKNGTIGSTRRRRRSKWSDINLTFHSYPIGPRVEQTIDL
jgi:hypothetical protein